MRNLFVLLLSICTAFSALPSCTNGSSGDFSVTENITPEEARTAALKDPEAPLFAGFILLEKGKDDAAEICFEAAAGLSRKKDGRLKTDSRLQKKIPFLIKAAAFSELCSLAEKKSREAPESIPYENLLLFKRIAEGREKAFYSGMEDVSLHPTMFSVASADLEAAALRTETAGIEAGNESTEADIKKIQSLVLDKLYEDAAEILFNLIAKDTAAKEALLSSRQILSACGRALLYSQTNPEISLETLEKLKETLESTGETGKSAPEAEYMLTFYMSRLYSKIPGGKEISVKLMESSVFIAPTEHDSDMSVWYLLDTARSEGDRALLAEIEKQIQYWKNPSAFSDILSSLITSLTAAKDTEALARLEAFLPRNVPAEIRERIAYINAVFHPEDSPARRERLETLYSGAVTPYYKAMAAAGLDISADLKLTDPFGEAGPSTATGEESAFNEKTKGLFRDQAENLIQGTLRWNMPEKAVAFFRAFPYAGFESIKNTAEEFTRRGFYSDAVRLVSAALSSMPHETRKHHTARNEVAELLNPRPWRNIVADAVAEFGDGKLLSEDLVYALIKQESLFNPDAVSYAGASGLTQIMDATAEEIAGKLQTEEYDIFLPEYNIKFGTFYLSEMLRRLDGKLIPALCAYNAGISRVREWLKVFNPREDSYGLFLEAIPYDETRNYAKNIFTFMNYYSALYDD